MEKFQPPKFFSEQELSAELGKNPQEIDYDEVLRRARNEDARRGAYHVAEYELRHMPDGEERWRQAIKEYYATHNPDTDGKWWMVMRLNELMGAPLKLGPLPEWDKAPPK